MSTTAKFALMNGVAQSDLDMANFNIKNVSLVTPNLPRTGNEILSVTTGGDDSQNWIYMGTDLAHLYPFLGFIDRHLTNPNTTLSNSDSRAVTLLAYPATALKPFSPVSIFMEGQYWNGSASVWKGIELENKINEATGSPEFWMELPEGTPLLRFTRNASTGAFEIRPNNQPGDKIDFMAENGAGGYTRKASISTSGLLVDGVITIASGLISTQGAVSYGNRPVLFQVNADNSANDYIGPMRNTGAANSGAHSLALVAVQDGVAYRDIWLSPLGGGVRVGIASAANGNGSDVGTGNLGVTNNVIIGGTIAVTGHTTLEGVTSTGATGTGKLVYDTAPTVSSLTSSGAISSTGGDISNSYSSTGTIQVSATNTNAAGVVRSVVTNDLGNYTEIGMWGSTRAAYGAIASGNGLLFSNTDLAIMADGTGVIKFAATGNAERMRLTAGLTVGSPTGGDEGAGTINAAGSIYKNGVAYTTISSADTLTNKTLTDQIDSGCKVVTSQFNAASGSTGTTLTNLTGLSVPVTAGATYIFQSHLTGTSTTNGGVKLAVGGTATATSISYTGKQYNGATINAISTSTTLGSAVAASTTVFTNADIYGAIVVNAGGTLTIQAAQNVSHTDTTSVYINGSFRCTRVA